MLDFCLIVISQILEAQAVPLIIHDCAKLMLQHFSLRRIHNAFKHGILNTLPVIDALLCNLPQSFASSGIFRVYIIGDQYQYLVHLISKKRADMRPSLPGDTVPTAMPAYTAPVPMAVFPPSKGG